MLHRTVVAFVGMSGVGKSTMLYKAREHIELQHLQATILIRNEMLRNEGMIACQDNLRERNISANQDLLLEGFNRNASKSGLVILDGHALIDTPHGPIPISSTTFKSLDVNKFIVVIDDPGNIYHRRSSDSSRSRPDRSIDELKLLQEQATVAACNAAIEARSHLLMLTSPKINDVVHALIWAKDSNNYRSSL